MHSRFAPSQWLRRLDALRGSHRNFWIGLTAVLVLGGMLAAVLGAQAVAGSEAQKAKLASHLASNEIAATLKLAIQHEEDLVVSASAYVSGNPQATPADFDRWANSVQAMRRYPELQNIGLVKLVPASRLASFERFLDAHPVRPLGPHSVAPEEGFQVLPAGRRPYYCFAVAGLARNTAAYIPAGADYCSLAPALITGRDSGEASYAPVVNGSSTTLGVSTPVYRGGKVPKTVAQRRRRSWAGSGSCWCPTWCSRARSKATRTWRSASATTPAPPTSPSRSARPPPGRRSRRATCTTAGPSRP